MAGSRLALVGEIEGRVLVIGARAGADLGAITSSQALLVQGFRPDHDALAAVGFRVRPDLDGLDEPFDAAVVVLPRSRAEARARVAAAAARLAPGATLWIDGQKTDGVEPMLRDLRALAPVGPAESRAHGKIFALTIPSGEWLPTDWAAAPTVVEGFVTMPGVFSADGPDPGSVLLAEALPARMPTRIVDLGAGWGWLSAHVLARPGVEVLHAVEADHAALACARRNLNDPRVRFHWADVTGFRLPEPVNGVVMNPPFHDGRTGDPALGARFIRAAAGLLTGAGRLWMVANRHLPYEAVLDEHFGRVEALGGDGRFKVITATAARSARRR